MTERAAIARKNKGYPAEPCPRCGGLFGTLAKGEPSPKSSIAMSTEICEVCKNDERIHHVKKKDWPLTPEIVRRRETDYQSQINDLDSKSRARPATYSDRAFFERMRQMINGSGGLGQPAINRNQRTRLEKNWPAVAERCTFIPVRYTKGVWRVELRR